MQKSEQALTQYRETNNAQSLDDRQNIVTSRLTNVSDQLTVARGKRLSKETVYNQIRSADPASDASDNFVAIGSNANVVGAKNALIKAQNDKATLLAQGYGPEWPAMRTAESDIEAARRGLVAARANVIESARNDFNAARLEESNYSSALEEAKGASMTLDKKGGDYKILENKANTDREVYSKLLTQQKNLSVIANSASNNVQVLERAEVPRAPISPNPRRDWMMALLAGIVVAFGLAFGVEYPGRHGQGPRRHHAAPAAAAAWAGPGDSRRTRAGVDRNRPARIRRSVPIFAHARWSFTAGSEHTRLIAVTSSQPLEGKTTTAANLAMALALGGSRVLLIDADMRRPGLHKTLGMENGTGLSHLLTGQARVREVSAPPSRTCSSSRPAARRPIRRSCSRRIG